MTFTCRSASPEQTQQAGRQLGRLLLGRELLLVRGGLGAGKTQFVKGVATALGIPESDVTSPSYVLMVPLAGRAVTLYHFDLYRLAEAADQAGVDEYIGQGVVAVEWAQYLAGSYFALPEAVTVDIDGAGEERTITVTSSLPHIRRP